jgi:hypothetical protein
VVPPTAVTVGSEAGNCVPPRVPFSPYPLSPELATIGTVLLW